jgi:hypothetical protein
MSDISVAAPRVLRESIARDLAPVRRLRSPFARSLALLPVAALLLVAAPLTFELRIDVDRLGWALAWGASSAQVAIGVLLAGAGLREAVPGRTWSRASLTMWIAVAGGALVAVTVASFVASPMALRNGWWSVGALCLTGSAISALPAVVLGSVLVARAWPTRPALAGVLAGLGAGMMSDAGWRLFCHFSEPAHVLTAHAGGVLAAAVVGAVLTWTLRRSTSSGSR